MSLRAFIRGVGLCGPGLESWAQGAAVLRQPADYRRRATEVPAPALLPSAERRRSGRVVRLAIAVAAEAVASAHMTAAELPSVFASSGGDGQNCHELCESLAAAAPEASPTRFTNSVHNAPAGYWSIATHAEREASVVSAFDASCGAGLLEALTQCDLERTPVLLVAYDCDYPPPLRAKRPVPDAFGMALVLEPARSAHSLARLEAELTDEPFEPLRDPSLEGLRGAIPAARALPLLEALAAGAPGPVVLEYLAPLNLKVRIEPCR